MARNGYCAICDTLLDPEQSPEEVSMEPICISCALEQGPEVVDGLAEDNHLPWPTDE